MKLSTVVAAYVGILNWSLPICIAIHLANLAIGTFLRAAFGGTLEFKE